MSRLRRFYFYAASLFSFVALLGAATVLLRAIVARWASGEAPAEAIGALLRPESIPWLAGAGAALAVWLFHWVAANRAARPLTIAGATERGAAERKAYLYLGQITAAGAAVAQALLGLRLVLLRLLGGGEADWPGRPAALLAGALLSFLFCIYLRWETARDDDFGREVGRSASWRRAYVHLAALAGSALVIGGAGELLRSVMRLVLQLLAPDAPWRSPLAGALAAIGVGVPLALLAWRRSNQAVRMAPAIEANALSRVLLRQGGVLFGTLVTLASLIYLVSLAVLQLLGRPAAGALPDPMLGVFDWALALAYLPVGVIAWAGFSGGLRDDAALGDESARTASIRRLVRYGLAGLLLGLFWFGIAEFVRLILQVVLGTQLAGQAPLAAQWWERFGQVAASVMVGAPAWWGHWWSQQVRARAPGPDGHAERSSAIRRTYLVGVVLLGACLVVAAAGFGAFLTFNWQAASELGGVQAAVAGAGAAALVSLFWVFCHAMVWRGDLRWLAAERAAQAVRAEETSMAEIESSPAKESVGPAPGPAGVAAEPAAAIAPRRYQREKLAALAAEAGLAVPLPQEPARKVAIVDGLDGSIGAALASRLCEALPDVLLWPIGLNAAAQVAMLDALRPGDGETPPAVPADALARVSVILGPADILVAGGMDGEVTAELSSAVIASPARVLLLPPRDARLRWVAAPEWPLDRWVENALIETNAALGEHRE